MNRMKYDWSKKSRPSFTKEKEGFQRAFSGIDENKTMTSIRMFK